MSINPDRVEEILMDCLFRDEEIESGEIPPNAVVAKGVVQQYGFHRERLEGYRDEVKAMLMELPTPFRKSGGGGWSFLNACMDAQGNQWTSLHMRMEQLFCLGIALGLVEIVTPKEMWPLMPGGVPYFMVVDDEPKTGGTTAKGMETDSER